MWGKLEWEWEGERKVEEFAFLERPCVFVLGRSAAKRAFEGGTTTVMTGMPFDENGEAGKRPLGVGEKASWCPK